MIVKMLLVFTIMMGCLSGQCQDTKCHLKVWAKKGCSQRQVEKGRRPCPGGDIYTCCTSAKESGICSWYDSGYQTANGERFNKSAMTAAHKTLSFGTRIRVQNQANGKSVVVRINDRGPFIKGRILDLTYAAFGKIENRSKGLTPCSYVII